MDTRLHIFSQRTLARKIIKKYEDLQKNMQISFENINFFSSTVDIWSANKKSYMGITLHGVSVL